MAEHTDAFLGWAAGIYDGEGFLYVKVRDGAPDRKARRFTLRAGIANTELAILEPFLMWGGRIRPKQGSALTKKQCYEWNVDARAARLFLADVLPHLRGKKAEKARLAVEFQEHMYPRRVASEADLAWRERMREAISA